MNKFKAIDSITGADKLVDAGGTLPTGAVNQTLRHDGTNWVANDTLKVTSSNVVLMTTTGNTDKTNLEITQSATHNTNYFLKCKVSNVGKFVVDSNGSVYADIGFTAKYTITNESQTGTTKRILYADSNGTYQTMATLAGTGNRSLYTTPDGTIMASDNLVKAKKVAFGVTDEMQVFSYTDVQLGMTGKDLRDKIISLEVYHKGALNNFYDKVQLANGLEVRNQSSIAFQTSNVIPNGDSLIIYMVYID